MPQGFQGTARFCIVLIDDEKLLCQTVQDILKESAITLVICHSPELAVSVVLENKPDLILLDVHFPHHNGLDILATLKQERLLRDIPVMIITANSQRETMERCFTLGAMDYLVKPFTVNYFKQKLIQCLGTQAFSSQEAFSFLPSQPHIRILEPDVSLQKLLTAVLKEQGYQVECLSSTQKTPRYKGHPALVILNSQLLDVSDCLQQCAALHIPVLHWKDVEQSSETHPFSVHHLVERVKQVLSGEQH